MTRFAKLPPYEAAHFVPPKFDPQSWPQIKKLYSLLQVRDLVSFAQTEQFLRDWNELGDVISEHFTKSHILTTLETNNKKYQQNYEKLITDILPKMKKVDHDLEVKYAKLPDKNSARYQLFNRQLETNLQIFRPKNIPLQTQEKLLEQKFQKIAGSLTASFDGKVQTLTQIGKVLEETDRVRREKAWKTISDARFKINNDLSKIFDALLVLRTRIAKNAGFKNYIDYRFTQMHRFDYTPKDCETFAQAVKKIVVPLEKKIYARRKKLLKVDKLFPWDLSVDAKSRPPLKPFKNIAQLVAGTKKIIAKTDSQFLGFFETMTTMQLLDLDNRKNKAPGAYQDFLSRSRLPFIFHNATGVDGDVKTLLHELGHSFNSFLSRDEWLNDYRHPPLEFAEVASMAMELLTLDKLGEFYSPGDAKRSAQMHLEEILDLLCWIAVIDSFQRWTYEHPGHTHEQRGTAWVKIYSEFYPYVDWSTPDLQLKLKLLWQKQHHIFLHPLYYIEYGIAQIGALQIYNNAKKDRAGTIKKYKEALSLGGRRPLPEIFATAGIKFKFDQEVIGSVTNLLVKELGLA